LTNIEFILQKIAAINIKNFALKNKTGVERVKVNVELSTVGTLKR